MGFGLYELKLFNFCLNQSEVRFLFLLLLLFYHLQTDSPDDEYKFLYIGSSIVLLSYLSFFFYFPFYILWYWSVNVTRTRMMTLLSTIQWFMTSTYLWNKWRATGLQLELAGIRVQMVGGLTEGNEAGTCFLTTNRLVHQHFPTLRPLLDWGHNCTFIHRAPRNYKNVIPSWTTSDSILCSFWDRTYLLENWSSLWFLSVKIHTCIQGWLYNLGSSVQNENVGPLFQKQGNKVPIKVLRYEVLPSLPQ